MKQAANTLIEHFDSVQVFASRHEPATEGGTVVVQWGLGNWYARYGQVKMWSIKEEGGELSNADDADDGDDDD